LSYLSYLLFNLPWLSKDSYLLEGLEGLQSADKTKCTEKQSYKMHPLSPEMEPLSCLFTFGNKNKNLYLPTV